MSYNSYNIDAHLNGIAGVKTEIKKILNTIDIFYRIHE